MEMSEAYSRGAKRPAARRDVETGKRRMAYAARACDACRKRKGKCCGRQPCEYCLGRNQDCHFSSQPGDWRPGSTSMDNITDSSVRPPTSWSESKSHGSLEQLVASLQGQINSLETQVRRNNAVNSVTHVEAITSSTDVIARAAASEVSPDISSNTEKRILRPSHGSSSVLIETTAAESAAGSKFFGPTSPDFSLNMVQMKLRTGLFSKSPQYSEQIASIDENQTDDEEARDDIETHRSIDSPYQMANSPAFQKLLQFRNYISMREAVRMLLVYQEVVGEYHPILDVDMLVKQVERWFTWPEGQFPPGLSAADEHNILVVNIAIAIALCIEPTYPNSGHANIRDKIYTGCQEVINAKVMGQNPSIKTVVVILLVGIYSFYQNTLQYSWRMCGLAGRVLMELGLHHQDVARHTLGTGQQLTEYTVVASSVIVLDRQWSAASGLPTNFSNSDFDLEIGSLVKTPYLKGMMAFIIISDKFSEPSSRVAKGGSYDDDDEFDIMNFQIEQWRKKVVGSYNFGRISADQPPSSFPPAWAILLHLRANAVRKMLLRPFFFSTTSTAASRRNIQPGLNLITSSLDMLYTLDKTTDIYRRHHPYFLHILFTSCALMFLIIVYVEQNRPILSTVLSDEFTRSITRNFAKAHSLAKAYKGSSRASRRLWKQLNGMERPLIESGLMHRVDVLGSEKSQAASNVNQPLHQGREEGITLTTKHMPSKSGDPPLESAFIDLQQDYPFSRGSNSPPDSLPGFAELNMDWTVELSEEWGPNSTNSIFWNV